MFFDKIFDSKTYFDFLGVNFVCFEKQKTIQLVFAW